MLYGKLKEYRLLITFSNVSEALKSERKLAKKGCVFETIPTPLGLSAGCGLSICLPREKEEAVQDLINQGICIASIYEAQNSGFLALNHLKNDLN
ncbi:MAG: DUF3343 domain-containing protein [Desulfitobacteriaceae bacterium]